MMFFELGVEIWVDWLVQIFIEVLECYIDENSKDLKYVYYYIVSIFCEIFNYFELVDFLDVFLNRLIDEKCYKVVLEILKWLRFFF